MRDVEDAKRESIYKQAAVVAALSLGTHSLDLTGGMWVARHWDQWLGRAYLRSLADLPQYVVVCGVLIVAAAALGARAWKRGARPLALALGTLAVLIPAELSTWQDGTSPTWLVAGLSVAAVGVSAALVVRGTRTLLEVEHRGLMLILGMLVIDLGSDLPFLLAGKDAMLSRINNTLHNDTLVHTFWLPLSLLAVLVSIGYHLWRRRRWEDIVRAVLGGMGAWFLYGIVEPKERILETLPSSSPEAAPLLHAIGWAHVGSSLFIVVALALLNHRALAVSRQAQSDP